MLALYLQLRSYRKSPNKPRGYFSTPPLGGGLIGAGIGGFMVAFDYEFCTYVRIVLIDAFSRETAPNCNVYIECVH